jgi:TonB-linked SusC/RagA family outer membrane protein
MRKIMALLAIFVFVSGLAFAQVRSVTGTVRNDKGEAVPFATVSVKGTNRTVTADAQGNFSISANTGDMLVFSSTGQKAGEIKVGSGNTVNASLGSTEASLDEVVVTALGIKREKKALGYSIQEVKGENLTIARSVDVSSSLAGKVAGVQLVGSPSSTFDNASILIRGVTGLGPVAPIFVVDGTITDQSAVIMDNVESLSVLKGPAATALYGQRAANGVVVITSKKGVRKKYTSVEVNSGVTIESLALLPPYQNSYAGGYTSASSTKGSAYDDEGFYIFKYNPAIHPSTWSSFNGQRMLEYGADESWGPKINGQDYRAYYSWYDGDDWGKLSKLTPQPNNVRDFFQAGRNINNSVALTSGGDTYNFRMSYNNQNRTLTVPEAKRNLHQLGINGSFDVGKLLTFSTDLTYVQDNRRGQPAEGYRLDGLNVTQNFNQWFQRQLDMKKMTEYRNADGSLNSWNIGDPNSTGDPSEYQTPQYWDNPYFVVKENYGLNNQSRLLGNVGLNMKFNKHINLQSFVRMTQRNGENDFRVATGGLNLDGYSVSMDQYREMNYESNLMYKNQFGALSVDGFLGGNIRWETLSGHNMATQGGLSAPNYFDITASIARPSVSRDFSRKKVNSVYGKVSLGYNNLLFVEGTLRNDWSSALPANNNSYLYPSVSGSFIFSELFKGSSFNKIMSYGKLRASYASVGSDLGFNQVNLAISNGSLYGSNPSMSIGNQFRSGNIRPALTKAFEVGAEFRFFNRFGLDVAFYQNNNTDQILSLDVSPSSGFSTAQVNAGNIQSRGIELSLSGTVVKSKNFNWDLTVNWARNSNLVKELAEGLSTYLYATNRYDTRLEHRVGQEWGAYIGRKFKTNDKGQTVILSNGQPDYTINNVIGNVLPKWTGGAYSNMRFWNFDLSFSLDFQNGGMFYSETRNFNTGAGLSEETVGLNDKGNDWRDYPGTYTLAGGNTGKGGIRIPGAFADGTTNNRYIAARGYWYTAFQKDGRNHLLDGSYLKLREVRFGYTIPSNLIQRIGTIKSLNVGVVVNNAWLIWANAKQYGVDPSELELFYREGGQLSQTRQVGFNIRATF